MTTQSLTLKPTESVTPDKRRRTLDMLGVSESAMAEAL